MGDTRPIPLSYRQDKGVASYQRLLRIDGVLVYKSRRYVTDFYIVYTVLFCKSLMADKYRHFGFIRARDCPS